MQCSVSPPSPLVPWLVGLNHASDRKLARRRGQCVGYHNATCIGYLPRSPELTFIVLARPLERGIPDDDDGPELQLSNDNIRALPMIGDVNLFFKHQRDDPEFEVECEVMIAGAYSTSHPFTHLSLLLPPALKESPRLRPLAEPAYRGQRRAHAALALLLSHARDTLSVRTESFVARIGASNARSIALFTALGFSVVRTVAVFDEVEMRVVDPGDMSLPGGQVREYP